VGDDERAALYAGLPIFGVKIWAYIMSGLLADYAGVLHTAQNHQGSPNAGISYELEAHRRCSLASHLAKRDVWRYGEIINQ
jgi:ribose transport system permease protein